MQSTVPADLPADRYGRAASRRTRTIWIAAVAVVVVVAVGWFAWAAYESRSSATGTDVGFDVLDNATVTVTFDVTKPQDKTATCVVQALDSGFDVVGTSRVQVGPADAGVVRRTATVRTTNRATTAQVTSCSLDN
jgi:hypothetical protein